MSDSPVIERDRTFGAPSAASKPDGPERICFSGTGAEYFGIWIVNVLLTIITLGIYAAWAKVRRTRYFYDNTRLNGSSFEYHGNAVAILKGRIIALVLVFGYQFAFKFSMILGWTLFALVAAVFPWLMWKSLQFKLYNSSYRGIRFGFRGSLEKAYQAYLLMPLAALFTMYLAMPVAHQQIKQFQHDESRFGRTHFSFHATIGQFYKIYLIGFLVMVGGVIAISILFGGTLAAVGTSGLKGAGKGVAAAIALFVLALFAWMLLAIPLLMSLTQNLIWNHTRLGEHRFSSDMKWGRTTFIAVTNLLGIVLTFGLYSPFAKIRMLRNRVESVSMIPGGSLDDFLAAEEQNAGAVGEGVSDLLDFDISL
jgi:uncharacterized membrane protein YjgN (DUF898 family)